MSDLYGLDAHITGHGGDPYDEPIMVKCGACEGTGIVDDAPCDQCHGEGEVEPEADPDDARDRANGF